LEFFEHIDGQLSYVFDPDGTLVKKLNLFTFAGDGKIIAPSDEKDKLTLHEARSAFSVYKILHESNDDFFNRLKGPAPSGISRARYDMIAKKAILIDKFCAEFSSAIDAEISGCDILAINNSKYTKAYNLYSWNLAETDSLAAHGHAALISHVENEINHMTFGNSTERANMPKRWKLFSDFYKMRPENLIDDDCRDIVLSAFGNDELQFNKKFRDYKETIQNFGGHEGGYALKLSRLEELKIAFSILLARVSNVFRKFVHAETVLSGYIKRENGEIVVDPNFKRLKVPTCACSGFVASVLVETLIQMNKLVRERLSSERDSLREELKNPDMDKERADEINNRIYTINSALDRQEPLFKIPWSDRKSLTIVSPDHLIGELQKLGIIEDPQQIHALANFVTTD
jgi:hypothetical protein